MTLLLDHVFVCTAVGAPEADVLRAAGFAEGPANVHPGKGTACRRFFFENAFLELFWVQDETEARAPETAAAPGTGRSSCWASTGRRPAMR